MKKFIIMIDDDAAFLDMMKDFYLKKRFEAELKLFVDAFEAMNFIVKNKDMIQLVFTDYNMKEQGMSGNIIVEKCNELAIKVTVVTSDPKVLSSQTKDFKVINKVASLSAILSCIENQKF